MKTDTTRWRKTATKEPSIAWQHRSQIAAHLIRPGDIVCDLGAGAQTLRRYLPPTVDYTPVDCVKEHHDTWVADFNEDFLLPEKDFTVITAIGLLTHLADIDRFLQRLAQLQPGRFFIFTHNPKDRIAFDNHLSEMRVVSTFYGKRICTATLGKSRPAVQVRQLDAIICANAGLSDYVRHRFSLAKERLKNGGNSGRTRRHAKAQISPTHST